MAAALGVDTVYLEKLISGDDFEKVNKMYNETEVMDVLKVCFVNFVYLYILPESEITHFICCTV